jgi:hypothetical protein
MRIRSALFLLLLASKFTYAQFKEQAKEYYFNINKGKICYVKKDYSKAVDFGIKGIEYLQPFREDLDQLAYWCSLAGRHKEAIKYYQLGVYNGLEYNDTAAYPDYYRARRGTKEYTAFINNLDSLHKTFKQRLNIDFCLMIQKMIAEDQAFRNGHLTDKDTTIRNFCSRSLIESDTNNMNALIDYFSSQAVPYEYEMTPGIGTAFKMLIHHMVYYVNYDYSKEKANILLGIIKKAIYEGRLPNSFLYNGLDRAHQLCCKTQLYGTYYSRTANGKITYIDIEDVQDVDKRREQWLLLPLYWSMRFNFDDRYQLPDGYTYKE